LATVSGRRVLARVLGLVLAAAGCGTEPAVPDGGPSVLIILVDDMRWDAMAFAGNPVASTPRIDELASQGLWFENAFVVQSLCSPSRASILTGLYPTRHGVLDNSTPLPTQLGTLTAFLKPRGYRTGFVGKWHMGNRTGSPAGGFDRWVSFAQQGEYFNPRLNIDGRSVQVSGHITDILTNFALEFLASIERGPFLLVLSHKAIHEPFTPQERFAGSLDGTPMVAPLAFGENLTRKPAYIQDVRLSGDTAVLFRRMRRYFESLRGIDESVGLMFDALATRGLLDSTMVFLMGDNGYLFGEHNLTDKRAAYEESMRVPLIVRYPTLFEPGARREALALNVDIMPTIVSVVTGQMPPGVDGLSLVALANGSAVRSAFLYEYHNDRDWPEYPTMFAWRTGTHKLITYPDGGQLEELYDLSSDPHEMLNLSGDPAVRTLEDTLRNALSVELARLRCPGC
jgi:N-acetylglucosamine-6-sulfatase